MEEHALLSSPRLENINTVFHKGEEEGRLKFVGLFAKCCRLCALVFPCATVSTTLSEGCQPFPEFKKGTYLPEVSGKQGPGLLPSFRPWLELPGSQGINACVA